MRIVHGPHKKKFLKNPNRSSIVNIPNRQPEYRYHPNKRQVRIEHDSTIDLRLQVPVSGVLNSISLINHPIIRPALSFSRFCPRKIFLLPPRVDAPQSSFRRTTAGRSHFLTPDLAFSVDDDDSCTDATAIDSLLRVFAYLFSPPFFSPSFVWEGFVIQADSCTTDYYITVLQIYALDVIFALISC